MTQVAQRHDVIWQQIYAWRHEFKMGRFRSFEWTMVSDVAVQV